MSTRAEPNQLIGISQVGTADVIFVIEPGDVHQRFLLGGPAR
jgi:hypothetical protein